MPDTVTQLDLFGEVVAAEQKRHVAEQRRLRDALVCLREAVPTALENIVELAYHNPADTRQPHASGNWAYCVCRAGLRFEVAQEWWSGAHDRGETWGWDRTPAHLVTWQELAELIGDDPRRVEIAGWVESLPLPRWKQLMRPKELWPDPEGWHIRHLCNDHVHEQWTARRRAWELTLGLLDDAITAVTP